MINIGLFLGIQCLLTLELRFQAVYQLVVLGGRKFISVSVSVSAAVTFISVALKLAALNALIVSVSNSAMTQKF